MGQDVGRDQAYKSELLWHVKLSSAIESHNEESCGMGRETKLNKPQWCYLLPPRPNDVVTPELNLRDLYPGDFDVSNGDDAEHAVADRFLPESAQDMLQVSCHLQLSGCTRDTKEVYS
jgi:hypothetical protein